MNLLYRPASPSEVPIALEMLPPGLSLSPTDVTLIASQWRVWRLKGLLNLTFIEQVDDLGNRLPVAFGVSLFVSDEFMVEIERSTPPPLLMAVSQAEASGRKQILSLEQIRLANSRDGLNLVIPLIGWRNGIEDATALSEIKAKLVEAFYFTHRGYNVKDVIQEVYSESEMLRAQAAGAKLRRDYYAGSHKKIPGEAHPYLIGVKRQDAVEGTYLFPLFFFNPPKFMFTLPEQAVLELAILDMSDAQIAKALAVGEPTIKKRWRSIFDRATAARHVPWLPQDAISSISEKSGGRGQEKRRHIVSYVRSHFEELRPYAPRKD